jgi:hypothetical protein
MAEDLKTKDLAFIDSLDDEQKSHLRMVIDSAKRNGVDPRLAAALAFRESSLRQTEGEKILRGSSGEIGIMQIKPSTGKLLGYELQQLEDPRTNIDAGMRYLRQSIDKFGNPMLGAAGYNAGPDHPFFSGKGDLDPRTVKYVNDIKKLGGFIETEEEQEAPPQDGQDDQQNKKEPTLKEEFEKRVPGFVGAGAGATTGLAIEAGKKVVSGKDLIKQLVESQIARQAPGPVAPSGAPGLPPPTGPLSNAPAGGRMTQNWIGAQDSAGRYADVGQQARSMGEAHRLKEAAIAAEDRIRQIAPEMAQVPQRAGLFVPQQIGSGPRGARTVPINPPPSLMDQATQKLGNIAKGGLRVVSSGPVAGALGGYGGAMSGVEAYQREKAGDRPGAILSGLGTLQALAAIPHPITMGVGLTASMASPLALAILDRYRAVRAQPPMPPATEAEMQEAQSPVFRYARP